MFLGFLVGTLCLIGLVRAVARPRWYRGGFRHYGGHGGWGGPYGYGYGYGHGGGWRRGRGFLFRILSRLDATPSQEKAIIGAIDELKSSAWELRGTVRDTRGDIARTIAGPAFDDSALHAATSRLDDASQRLRAAVAGALGKIHGVLDDRQRKVLAEMIESGWAPGC
jgi:hypothetical protein